MSKLSTYLAEEGISGRAFAKRIGVHPSVVSKLQAEKIRASIQLAFKIEAETGGKIPVAHWLNVTPAKRKKVA